MKTTYILHGGFTPNSKQINDLFFAEIVKRSPENPTILIVYFATENGDKYFPEDSEQLNKNSEGKSLNLVKATEDNFERQLADADVIYLHGGSSKKLASALKKFPTFSELVRGKVIAGDSAGSKVLTNVLYTSDNEKILGIGLLPYTIIPHYKDSEEDSLKGGKQDSDTIYLHEYEFRVIEMEQ